MRGYISANENSQPLRGGSRLFYSVGSDAGRRPVVRYGEQMSSNTSGCFGAWEARALGRDGAPHVRIGDVRDTSSRADDADRPACDPLHDR